MRYEHIELDISTAACALLLEYLMYTDYIAKEGPELEVHNFKNNLRARLQRRDVDPHCPLNASEDWLDG